MIEVQQVSRAFGTFKAVDSISFSIKTGEIVGLLGPNGAGKTTTMRMITGFLEMDSGSIKIDNVDICENPKESKRKIGYMPESAPLYSEMIVADYLEYVAQMYNVNPKEKVPQLAKTCGLTDVMHKNISGIVSKITSAFANEDVNIDNMVNKSKGEYAYTVVDSDTEASAEAINALKKINGIIRIRVIK